MITNLLSLLALAAASLAAQAQPPATQPASPYEQALAGLRALHEENLLLRARLTERERQDLPEIRIRAGEAVHLRADEIAPLPPEPHLADFRWNFGDPESRYDDLGGFNAAHLYERPGTYVISLNGKPVRRAVVVEDTRAVRVVKSEQELAAAAGVAGSIVRLPAGAISVRQTIRVAPGVAILGDEAGSTINWIGGPNAALFDAPSGKITLRNITFDAPAAAPFEKTPCNVLHPGGSDIAVIGCTFLNVNDGINGNRRPARVLMQDCRAPSETGIRSYLAWVEGEQWVLLGNIAVNSTREHIFRCGPSGPAAPAPRFILAAYNDLSNLDRRSADDAPDKGDIAKTCLFMQAGEFGWAEHNLFRGISGAGPLGGPDARHDPNRRFRYVVFRDNRHLETLHIEDGAEHVLIADSRFELPRSGGNGFSSVQIAGPDAEFKRSAVDVTLRDCVLVSPFKNACQLWIKGPISDRFEMTGNTFVGGKESYRWGTMPFVIDGGWQVGYVSRNNELPAAPGGWPDKNAFARFGDQNDQASYVTLARWLALAGVSGDKVGTVAMKVE